MTRENRKLRARQTRLGLSTLALLVALSACSLVPNRATRPEIILFEVSPLGVTAGEKTTFIWQLSHYDGVSCTLDVDGDGSPDYAPDCEAGQQSHTFTEAGRMTVNFQVERGNVTVSESLETYVQASGNPSSPVTGLSWQLSTPQDYRVAEAQGLAVGGKLYSFGGFDKTKRCCTPTNRAYVFDPERETWATLSPMPEMNSTGYGGVSHSGISTDGQDIFFAGGYTSNDNGRFQIFGTREVWRYHIARDSYSRLPDLPVARAAGQLEYYNGKLYFFGGTNQPRTHDVGNLFILDLAGGADAWTEGAPLPNPRNHLGGVVLEDKIYAIAGQHDHDGNLTTQSDVHVYDPKNDSWSEVASLPLALSHISDSSFVMDGRIIVIGGEYAHLKTVDTVFAYDPAGDSWSEFAPLPSARMSMVADYVSGKIVVTGGSVSQDESTYIGSLE